MHSARKQPSSTCNRTPPSDAGVLATTEELVHLVQEFDHSAPPAVDNSLYGTIADNVTAGSHIALAKELHELRPIVTLDTGAVAIVERMHLDVPVVVAGKYLCHQEPIGEIAVHTRGER